MVESETTEGDVSVASVTGTAAVDVVELQPAHSAPITNSHKNRLTINCGSKPSRERVQLSNYL